jgi:hypothetical protein
MLTAEKELIKEKTVAILQELNLSERELMLKVIKAEREKLHMSRPRGIYEDIWKIVTETIK